MVNGHAIYIDSEWALTSISQRQFWRGFDFAQTGDGQRRRDPLGRRLGLDGAQPAARQDRHALHPRRDRRGGVGAARTTTSRTSTTTTCCARFLDPAIEFPNPTEAANLEPLLVNTAGSWAHRPDAVTRIPNLFLASDYVRTHTDLATMEGANEAARRAVNGILAASGSTAPRVRDLAAVRAGGVRAREGAGPHPLEAVPPPAQAAAADDGGRGRSRRPGRWRPGWCASARWSGGVRG